ncbi:MAG: ATP-dependent sacrificial sulfur transferase LarE [Candidatus Bathyarchaeia archaeon]
MAYSSRSLNWRLSELIRKLGEKESVLVALSGGVDSSLVAAASKIALEDRAVAITADSATLPPGELEAARRVAEEIGIRHLVVKVDELRNPNFVRNKFDRCYYCKKELIAEFKKVANQLRLKTLVDGTNAEDLKANRPGSVALMEEGVYSPLADLGITKGEVRELARLLNLSTVEKPSMACLATRIPYGEEITLGRLSRVAEAERFIKDVVGVKQLRVRDHGNLARVEVGRDERSLIFNEKILESIANKLHSLGYVYVTVDVDGYRSGSMDGALKP